MRTTRKSSIVTLALLAMLSTGLTTAPASALSPVPASACGALQDVFHVVNPTTQASLFTTSATEANAGTAFTEKRGVIFETPTSPIDGLTAVHRLLNAQTGDYLWALEGADKDQALKLGYKALKVDFYAAATPIGACKVPVYRYAKGGMHRFVVAATDRATLVKAGWRSQGIKFYAAPDVVMPPMPVAPPVTPVTPPVLPPTPPATVTTPPAAETLSWAPPQLVNPITVKVTSKNRDLHLDPAKDYIIEMPSTPLEAKGGLNINGGHNVVLFGGGIVHNRYYGTSPEIENRGVFLGQQTGTIHIEGLKISGDALSEGFDLDQRKGATVQIQNVHVGTVRGTQSGTHADVIQSWAGPKALRVDNLTGSTTYQGMLFLPKQFGTQPEPELFDLRNVNIKGTPESAYMMWRDGSDWPIKNTEVYVSPRALNLPRSQFLWARGASEANKATWNSVKVGTPPNGDFVNSSEVGIGYISPGYTK